MQPSWFKKALGTLLISYLTGGSALFGNAPPSSAHQAGPSQRPNVLIFLLDDVGFGHLSPFGGTIETRNIARIAARGLRYTNFHTAALCSPTRAALLTGRNHHSVGMGVITELQTEYPGYTGHLPKNKALFAKSLEAAGYRTMATGKWHNTPVNEVTTQGPYERWPLGLGFQRWYGFLAADTSQWNPPLWDDKRPIDPAVGDPNYHLTKDITDQAIAWLREQGQTHPDAPFFLYYAPGAAHAPHHAPAANIAKYAGKFDDGWDAAREKIFARQKAMGILPEQTQLSERPDAISAWSQLLPSEQRLYARMQEVFAGFVDHTDEQFGRLIDELEASGQLDNTIIIITSDNGASGEGGMHGSLNEVRMFNGLPERPLRTLANIDKLGTPQAFNHYPAGWALAGNTPLRYWKQITHEGGVRDPMIVAWPRRIQDAGGIRNQFTHAIDIAPTIYELTGVEGLAVVDDVVQAPLEGTSFAPTMMDKNARSTKSVQYFEMLGNRSIWADGWKAVTFHGRLPWRHLGANADFDSDVWELYRPDEDPAETNNLAALYPEKLADLKALWHMQAARYNVYPLDDSTAERLAKTYASFTEGIEDFVYHEGDIRIPEAISPPVKNRTHTIEAEVEIPQDGAEGILATAGGRFSGYAFYVKDQHLHYVHNYMNDHRYSVTSDRPIPLGTRAKLSFKFTSTFFGRGQGELFIDGQKVGEGTIEKVVPAFYSASETFDVGLDTGTPVDDSYQVPFKFTGKIATLKVHVKPKPQGIAEETLAPLAD